VTPGGRRWRGVGIVAVVAAAGIHYATPVLAADASPAPTLSVAPSAVAPGEPVTVVYHMASIPSNFPLPNCQTVDLVSSVVPPANGGVLAVATVSGPGDIRAAATIPAAAQPGTYTVDARACGVTWASTTVQVTMAMPSTGSGMAPGRVDLAALLVAGGLLLMAAARRAPTVTRLSG